MRPYLIPESKTVAIATLPVVLLNAVIRPRTVGHDQQIVVRNTVQATRYTDHGKATLVRRQNDVIVVKSEVRTLSICSYKPVILQSASCERHACDAKQRGAIYAADREKLCRATARHAVRDGGVVNARY